ncbi:MAG: N-acetylmuramoyl-L-alanine amidase [Prevotellaceae bacterium]|nr:N-acetylmuramoyl-L-alanine amidase [Prevotellaceae bacterium]
MMLYLKNILRCLCFLLPATGAGVLQAQVAAGGIQIRKVVIDAGHGGVDPGVIGKQLKEKNVVLDIALKVGAFINEAHPDVETIYTRDADVFVELTERTNIANRNNADFFISIHANSVLNRRNTSTGGFETYILGMDQSDRNMEVAKRENAVISYEKDYATKYEGYDPNSPESFIIFSLMQNSYFDQSLMFASMVQDEMEKGSPVKKNRGIKQQPLLVIWRTAMPSVLIEVGFLSNPDEEDLLKKEKTRESIAKCIATAFSNYKAYYERKHKPGTENTVNATAEKTAAATGTTNNNRAETATPPPATGTKTTFATTSKSPITYAVQVFVLSVRRPVNAPEFSGLENIRCFPDEQLFKYTVGNYETEEQAQTVCNKLHKEYPRAFVVAIQDNKIIKPTK